MRSRPPAEALLLLVCLLLFSVGLFRHLSYPLLWQDEAETAMFATRVREYGYPKVHGERNVVNEFGDNAEMGVKQPIDAYIGVTWAQFYYAVPGIILAEASDDLYVKTLLLRLPFAVTGALGLWVLVLAVAPVFRGDRRRLQIFATAFFLLATVSLSLVLHLREVRYYALLVFLVTSSFWVYLRYAVFGALGFRTYALSLAILRVLVFNTFSPAYFVFVAAIGLDRLVAAHRADGSLAERIRRELPNLAPILASAILVGPLLVFYETFSVASAFSEAFGFEPERYIRNLGRVLLHYLRHEFLAAAIASRLAVYVAAVLARRRGVDLGAELPRRVTGLFGLFVVIYLAVGCVNPLFYERYFIVLSPFVTAIFLLDAFALVEGVPRLISEPRRRTAERAVLGGLLTVAMLTVGIRAPDLRGRLEELTRPYRGVLDFAIPYLKEQYAHPEDLVIATNYAAHTYMYYLGSHVIVGMNLNNIDSDRLLEPDVVILRRKWPKAQGHLRYLLRRGRFRSVTFPVADTEFNNIPALSLTPWLLDRHRYRTATTYDPELQLRIFERIRSE